MTSASAIDGPPEPGAAPRRARSHDKILETAFALIVERGYGRVTIEAIAAAAGVGKPTIYRWWPSKGALALEAINHRIGTVLDFPSTGDIATDLATQINGAVSVMNGPIGVVYRGIIAEAQSDPAIATAVRTTIIEPRTRDCQRRLAEAVTVGQLRGDVPTREMVELLYGPIYYRFLLGTDVLDPVRTPQLIARVLDGLRPRPANGGAG
ncbi:MAG: TetR/AcrR family transcriptional regulator [Catenulispora sp.]|nr:TetR/AcrR family transcriptional regulator [Catenulispora sp.]